MARVAFYAPLKSPEHPIPSGDRTVARNLMAALRLSGHQVTLASQLRSHTKQPTPTAISALEQRVDGEIKRLLRDVQDTPPDIWFTYHLYYKAPDLIGPEVSRILGIPYVVAEASHSERRMNGPHAVLAAKALSAMQQADAVLYVTHRDGAGLHPVIDEHCLHHLPPFTLAQPARPPAARPRGQKAKMLAVGMMRPGDKTHSYQLLAAALRTCTVQDWQLTIVGDGSNRQVVEGFFRPFGTRVSFLGQLPPGQLVDLFHTHDFQVWPGVNEAYGMTLLDGLMQGLPVVAGAEGGVPDIVHHQGNGLLSAPRNASALARNIAMMIRQPALQQRLALQAWRQTRNQHSVARTSWTLGKLIADLCGSS